MIILIFRFLRRQNIVLKKVTENDNPLVLYINSTIIV